MTHEFDIRISACGISRARRLTMVNLALRGIDADLVDGMVVLPGQLFYSTQIPVCVFFIGENGNASTKRSAFRTAEIYNHPAMGKAHSNFSLN